MNSHLLEDRVEFFQLKTLRVVLLVFYRDVAAGAGLTTGLMLGAFQDHLYTVTFLCHTLCY